MEFNIEKCVMMIMKMGKKESMKGTEKPNQENIETLAEE